MANCVYQKWEGVIQEVLQDTFIAELLTVSGSEPDKIAEIYNTAVNDSSLIFPGAMFTWTITEHSSIIEFIQLPKYTKQDIERIKQQAIQLESLFSP